MQPSSRILRGNRIFGLLLGTVFLLLLGLYSFASTPSGGLDIPSPSLENNSLYDDPLSSVPVLTLRPPFTSGVKVVGGTSIPPSSTLLVTLIYDLSSAAPDVWSSLRDLCLDRPMVIALLYALGDPAVAVQELEPRCGHYILVSQALVESSMSPDARRTWMSSRIHRLGVLRGWQRLHLLPLRSVVAAVLVVDLDIVTFPSKSAVDHAVDTVGGGAADVVCANGYEEWLGMKHYYDSFALVWKNGDWAFWSLTNVWSILFLVRPQPPTADVCAALG